MLHILVISVDPLFLIPALSADSNVVVKSYRSVRAVIWELKVKLGAIP